MYFLPGQDGDFPLLPFVYWRVKRMGTFHLKRYLPFQLVMSSPTYGRSIFLTETRCRFADSWHRKKGEALRLANKKKHASKMKMIDFACDFTCQHVFLGSWIKKTHSIHRNPGTDGISALHELVSKLRNP